MWRKLAHENLMKVYGTFRFKVQKSKISSDTCFSESHGHLLVMELCHGNLRDLSRARRLFEWEILSIVLQIANGLACLHQNNIMHR